MTPLSAFDGARAARLRGVVFDLDGTVLTDGALTLEAYGALFAMRDAGLRLVACTGRPAGWGAVVARQWPIDLAVTENGALAFRRDGARVLTLDRLPFVERRERRARLDAIVRELREKFPRIPLADDNHERRSDVTFDVRETVAIDDADVFALRRAAEALGARTFESSIHVHVSLDADDKASGTVRAIRSSFGDDASRVLAHYAFVGDSGNDEACFAAFSLTFAVANVARWVRRLSVPPRVVADSPEGAGFAAIARALVAAKGGDA